MYNTVVQLCQFFCCGRKVNFVQIPYSHDRFSKISRNFFVIKLIPYKTFVREDQLFLALYVSTTIQSQFFFLISRTLFDFLNNTHWVSLFLRNVLTGVSCFFVTFFYSTLLALTHRRNYRGMKHSLGVGWRNFFSSCAVMSVFGSGGK